MSGYKQSPIECSNTDTQLRRLRRRARTLAESGNVTEAIGYQTTLAAMTPNDFETFMQLGFLHRAVSDIDAAAKAFHRASGLDPLIPDPHEALAEMFLDAARYDDAICESKTLLRLTPHSIAARDILSTAYFQKGEIGKALETTSEMVRLAPSDPLCHYKRGVLHQQRGDWRNALQEFIRAAEMSPADSVERSEAEAAIDALDQHQIRQILILSGEDRLFQMQLSRDPEEATRERGYFLTNNAANFVGQVASDRLTEEDLYVFSPVAPTPRRPQLYN